MADEKISALTAASSVADADTTVVVQSGASKKSAMSVLFAYVQSKFAALADASAIADADVINLTQSGTGKKTPFSSVLTYIIAGFNALSAGSTMADADTITVTQSGTSKKSPLSDLFTYIQTKTAALGNASALADADTFTVRQSGTALKAAVSSIFTYIQSKFAALADAGTLVDADIINLTQSGTGKKTALSTVFTYIATAFQSSTIQVLAATISGARSAAAFTIAGIGLKSVAATYTDTTSTGTVADQAIHALAQPTLAASGATTFTRAYTLYIDNGPAAGSNATLTNSYALGTGSNGRVRFGNTLSVIGAVDGNSTATFGGVVSGSRLSPTGATATGNSISLPTTNTVAINTNGTERFRLGSGGEVYFPGAGTTASAANAFLDSGSTPVNQLLRSTSSAVYKDGVEDLWKEEAEKLLQFRPVYYKSKCVRDNPDWGYVGFIAEEIAAICPRYVNYGYQEHQFEDVEVEFIEENGEKSIGIEKRLKDGEQKVADGVQYDRMVVGLVSLVQDAYKRIEALEAKLAG